MSSCCATKDVMFLACSGGSNVGQIANDAAKQLDSLGQGKMFCAVGIAALGGGFTKAASEASCVVAIDGCEVACVRKAMEREGLSPHVHVVATNLGIEKAHRFDYTQEEVATVGEAVTKAVAAL